MLMNFTLLDWPTRCQPKSAVAVGGADFEDAFGVHGAEECGDDVGGLRIEVEIADGMIGFGVIRFALLVEFFKEIDELGIHAVRLSSCRRSLGVCRSRTCRSAVAAAGFALCPPAPPTPTATTESLRPVFLLPQAGHSTF